MSSRQQAGVAVGAFKRQFLATIQTEAGAIRIIRLAMRANHVSMLLEPECHPPNDPYNSIIFSLANFAGQRLPPTQDEDSE